LTLAARRSKVGGGDTQFLGIGTPMPKNRRRRRRALKVGGRRRSAAGAGLYYLGFMPYYNRPTHFI